MKNFIPIRDFYLAAYLVAAGIKMQSHHKQNDSTIFNFNENDRTDEAINSYYSMSANVEPVSYGNAIKALKSIVHSYDYTNKNSEVNNNVKQYRGTKSI